MKIQIIDDKIPVECCPICNCEGKLTDLSRNRVYKIESLASVDIECKYICPQHGAFYSFWSGDEPEIKQAIKVVG